MTEKIEEMIEYCADRGDIEFELNGERWGICSGSEKVPYKGIRRFWYFCDPNDRIVEEWGDFDSVNDIFNARVFNGKSLTELFEFADFSMN